MKKIGNTPLLAILPVTGTAVVFAGWSHKEPLPGLHYSKCGRLFEAEIF